MRFTQFKLTKLTEAILNEVSMSPTSLQRWADSAESDGMLMGIEFEMTVPIAQAREDILSHRLPGKEEPDYSYDRNPRDIDDVVEFFKKDPEANALRTDLEDQYEKWKHRRIIDIIQHDDEYSSWLNDSVIEWLGDTYDEDDNEKSFNEAEAKLGKDASYKEIEGKATEIRNAFAQNIVDSWRDTDQKHDLYKTAYNECMYYWVGVALRRPSMQQMVREERWFSDREVSMAGIAHDWDLKWPYIRTPTINDIADIELINYVGEDFSKALGGVGFDPSDSYHSIRNRNSGKWIIETDSSIDKDSGSLGLEFVSPAQPIAKTLEDMTNLIKWAKGWGCTTNKSTGLHMNISVPDFEVDTLDYVKLAMFMGDTYILDQFGRAANTYCKSATSIINRQVGTSTGTTMVEILDKMRDHLNLKASKLIHSGMTDKFTSINTKTKYVEFRGPGGDYLNKPIAELTSTSLRLAMALTIACNETAHKEEYSKKLYKLIAPLDSSNDMVSIFARYSSGELDKYELSNELKTSRDNRPRTKSNLALPWWSIVPNRDLSLSNVIKLQARNKQDALKLGLEQVKEAPWYVQDAWANGLEDNEQYGKGSGFHIEQLKTPPVGHKRIPRQPKTDIQKAMQNKPTKMSQRPEQTFTVWVDGFAHTHRWNVQSNSISSAIAKVANETGWNAGNLRGDRAVTQATPSSESLEGERSWNVWALDNPGRSWTTTANSRQSAVNSIAAYTSMPAHLLDAEWSA